MTNRYWTWQELRREFVLAHDAWIRRPSYASWNGIWKAAKNLARNGCPPPLTDCLPPATFLLCDAYRLYDDSPERDVHLRWLYKVESEKETEDAVAWQREGF